MKRRPRILMTTSNIYSAQLEPITGDIEILYSDKATANAIIKSGGLPLYLPSTDKLSNDELAMYLELADGLLITGADSNVNPIYYGESPLNSNKTGRIDDERDRIDLALIRLAHKRKIPMVGICKGMQLINVALGGTLYQDVNSQHPGSANHDISKTNRANFTHLLTISAGSLAEKIFGKGEIHVNGGHKQAVKDLAPLLKATAKSADGVIEIYEGDDYPFLLGAQFHPELRAFDPTFSRLFEQFIATSAPHEHPQKEGNSAN